MPNESLFNNHQEYLDWYKEYREKNRKKLRKYGRIYNKQHRKENGYHNEKNWKKKNPKKVNAQQLLQCAVRKGMIKRQSCEVCGNEKSQGHHDDYFKPLEVRWLCALCHKQYHTKKLINTPTT